MVGIKTKAIGWLKNPKVRWGLLTGVWLVLVVTVVFPTWQGVISRNNEIKIIEADLATMDDWTVAGMRLAPWVNQRTLPLNGAFSRLFPTERRREELFFSLAMVADQSGVVGFGLSEANETGMFGNDVWNDGTAMAGNDDAPPPTDGSADALQPDLTLEVPKVELSSYRVKADFSGDYQRIANFMNGLKNIERALKVHSLVIRPERDDIQVKLELDVYVSKTI